MKLYLAGPWIYRESMALEAERLKALGFEIVHAWWDEDPSTDQGSHAVQDLRGVRKCQVLVVYDWALSGGKAFETGYAMALNKPVIWYDPAYYEPIIFFHHPAVTRVWSFEELDVVLESLRSGRSLNAHSPQPKTPTPASESPANAS